MGGEFASGELDDLGGLDAAEIERALSEVEEMELAALPSFKQLPPRRRIDRPGADIAGPPRDPAPTNPRQQVRVPPPTRTRVPRPAWLPEPAQNSTPTRAPEPLQLTEAMRLAAPMVPAQRRRRLPWRAAVLLLIGAALGTGAALALSAPQANTSVVVSQYLASLPPAVPAAPPPQIVYVDKWQIVSPEPRRLAPYATFAPAMPVEPPSQIIIVDRPAAPSPPRRGAKATHTVAPRPAAQAQVQASDPHPAQSDTPPSQQDVAKELERWFAGTADRR